MSKQILRILASGAFILLLAACQQTRLAEIELQAVQTASDVYRAYGRGDCETVYALTEEEDLQFWQETELRYSLALANAFCREREGDTKRALVMYKRLRREAKNTFAAADAAERIKLLGEMDADPEYRRWVEEAIETARPSEPTRAPLSRIPAQFPPAARAAGIEGFAVVQFGVTPSGETEDLLIVASEPPLLFDGATLRAVRQWLFVEEPDSAEQSRQVIRILFLSDSEVTVEDAERLTE